MKKFILLLLLVFAITTSAFSERTSRHMQIHQSGTSGYNTERERSPINLPIAVYYDSDTNILEVWCDNDNILGEVFIYDESESMVAYSPYMNVTIQLPTSESYAILIKGDGWEAEGQF